MMNGADAASFDLEFSSQTTINGGWRALYERQSPDCPHWWIRDAENLPVRAPIVAGAIGRDYQLQSGRSWIL